ncbi:MAG: hypothetical protein FWE04_01495 [Oscillospiraceae bacterium]|nr:hypothetical protein [Oscillospiraceae bacterium]
MFSGTVRVRIRAEENHHSGPEITLHPAANLFVRHDRGLRPRDAASYREPNANGLIWQSPNQGNQLVIGMDHAATNDEGAHRETFVRFDLPIDPTERAAVIHSIMNTSGVGEDSVRFNLFITQTVGRAAQRHIDLHLLPADRAGVVNTTHLSLASPRQLGSWMSAYDAFRAGITAREHFRHYIVRPDATSCVIRNPAQTSPVTVNDFVSFNLTEPLQRYFTENPNARSFAFVLSNLRENGLMIALAYRNSTPENRRPYLTIPGTFPPPTVAVSTRAPAVDLFVRSDTGTSARTRAEIAAGGAGNVPHEIDELVIGQNHLSSNTRGAYRETLMRFELSSAEIAGILNASGRGNDRAVLNLFVKNPPPENPAGYGIAQSRAINVRLVPDNAIRRGMTYRLEVRQLH